MNDVCSKCRYAPQGEKFPCVDCDVRWSDPEYKDNDDLTKIVIPKDKEDYLERIDRSLKELEEGKTMDAKKALELICSEIENEKISG